MCASIIDNKGMLAFVIILAFVNELNSNFDYEAMYFEKDDCSNSL